MIRDIYIKGYAGSTPPAPATVNNSDNTYTESVASGGVLVLPDTTFEVYVNGILNSTVTLPSISNNTINITN